MITGSRLLTVKDYDTEEEAVAHIDAFFAEHTKA
jgi:hypothetical protein